MEIDVQTLVLVDNSFSVSKVNREITRATLKYLFTHTPEGRAYCFTPFSHDIEYAESYTVDYIGLEDMADRLEYENKEASITDVLSSVIDKWEKSDFACRDIIILTDGLEEASLNYEREEMFYLLEHNSYPVYIVCLNQDNNESVIKNLSAICRVSGGQLFRTEFEGSEAEVERKITQQILDAMERYKSENWDEYYAENTEGEEDSEEISGEEADDNAEADSTKEEEISFDDAFLNAGNGEDVIYETLEEGVDFSPVTYAVFGSSLFLAICGVFLSWCLFIKHKQKVKREEEEYRDKILNLARESRENACYSGGIGPGGYEADSKNSRLHAGKDIGETVSLLRRMPSEQQDRATRLLGEAMGRTDITFEDLADPSKYFRVPANGKIILGRSNSCCDMAFEYDDSVSSKHCEIFLRDEHWFVRDLGSSNGTYINGDKVYTELEIRTGDMLKMGTLAVIVRF